MYESSIDVAVLLIFFCRDDKFKQVFDVVKKARPSRLYLYQDGARVDHSEDIIGIKKCREIADDKNINWNCKVQRFYQEKNYGCDPSEYIAQTWFFRNEEMGIILEDDDVPAQSFFKYCKELLEYYKNDSRINMIGGMNHLDIGSDFKGDYSFVLDIPIWGWASWRRVIDTWDPEYKWMKDPDKLKIIKTQLPLKEYNHFIKYCQKHCESGVAHYETILSSSMYINKRLSIIPKYNMISNIGIGKETTHSVDSLKVLPKKRQKYFYKKRYEIEFPLKHPDRVVRNIQFENKIKAAFKLNIFDKLEWLLRGIIFGGISYCKKTLQQKLESDR